jgi:SAM-dependent methyltransferase
VNPEETGRRYDAIAAWWNSYQDGMDAGLNYLERAIGYCSTRRTALDVGCGSGGRMIAAMIRAGFAVTGVDVSAGMIANARERHPQSTFVLADICAWAIPNRYDLIVAWESTFHLPHHKQQPVLEKMCAALAVGGVLLFTAGSSDGEITGEMQGETFYYSSLGTSHLLRILEAGDCECLLVERDQYPERHLVVVARKGAQGASSM